MVPRPNALKRITSVLSVHPIAALLGPRQCGKTTLARMISEHEPCTYFDLENPVDIRRLDAPLTALESPSRGWWSWMKSNAGPTCSSCSGFWWIGLKTQPVSFSWASPNLVKGVSESLAGRIGFIDLSGFGLQEVGTEQLTPLWVRGGFPRSFLAFDEPASMAWREDFIRTFVERDIPQLGITIPAETMRRFWTMIAHYHGQVWNAAQFAKSIGTSESTARRYLDILTGAYMLRILPPWFANIRKRQVKAPKIYIRDSGILHTLLQLRSMADLQTHPKFGASWEGFALEQIIAVLETCDTYFWATHAGAELDLLVMVGGKRYGFEFKYADAPSRSRSMHIADQDLGLEHLWVIYPGHQEYPLDEKISVIPIDFIPRLGNALLKK